LFFCGCIDDADGGPGNQVQKQVSLDIVVFLSPDPSQDQVHFQAKGTTGRY